MGRRELHNRKNVENLIAALTNYLPGDREQLRSRTSRLLEQIMDEKALTYLRKKFQLQAYKTLQPIIDDLEMIGEGVETEEERQAMLGLGCKIGQGYLMHRPAFLESFTSSTEEHDG